jgi:hypothetical protein
MVQGVQGACGVVICADWQIDFDTRFLGNYFQDLAEPG